MWRDLFWPNTFDLIQPFIFVDERLGEWTHATSTTARNFQGDLLWIDLGIPPEIIAFAELQADGTFTAVEYEFLVDSDARAADVVAYLESDAGWTTLMHCWLLSLRLESNEYMNLIVPYEEFDFKQSDPIECFPCVVDACVCPDGSSPDEQQTNAYATDVCNLQCQHNRRRQEIIWDRQKCKIRKIGLGALGVGVGCLGLACPSGVTQIAGGAAVIGSVATTVDAVGDCKRTAEAAMEALSTELRNYRELRCLVACALTPSQP